MEIEFTDEYRILLLEESSTRRDLFSQWMSGVASTAVADTTDLITEFDSSVTVVALSHEAVEGDSEAIQKYILTHNPYCQIVGLVPRSESTFQFEDEFDDVLQRPVFKEEFTQTMEYRYLTGIYSNLLSELYDLNAGLVSVRQADGDEDDRVAKERRLQRRYDTVSSRLNELQEILSQDTILDIMRSLERHDRYLSEPDEDASEGRGTKYRSRRCPSCKLPWGVDHRNELGKGFTSLGADVYQCARCDSIVHGLAGDKRVL